MMKKTVIELVHERPIIDRYANRANALKAQAADAFRTVDAMLQIVYPAWDPNFCTYEDGIIIDHRKPSPKGKAKKEEEQK